MHVKVNTFFSLRCHLDVKNYEQQLVTAILRLCSFNHKHVFEKVTVTDWQPAQSFSSRKTASSMSFWSVFFLIPLLSFPLSRCIFNFHCVTAGKEWNLMKRNTHVAYGMNKSSFNQCAAMCCRINKLKLLPQRVHQAVHPPEEKSSPLHGQPGPAPLPSARGGVFLGGLGSRTPLSRWALHALEQAVLPLSSSSRYSWRVS